MGVLRSTWKVFSGLRRMSEDFGAGTQPGSCEPQEGIPGASLDSSGSGRVPGFFIYVELAGRGCPAPVKRYNGSAICERPWRWGTS
eukprot:scaffold2382_cov108-Isochrysis_galbana.AAC.5